MQGLFTIDHTKSEQNAKKVVTVLPKSPSVVIPVWGKKVIQKEKMVGLRWVKYNETVDYRYH